MKKIYLYLYLFCSIVITVQSCNSYTSISNDISGIKNSDQQIIIRNWKITGPLNESDFSKDNIQNQQKYITTGNIEESDENKKTKTIFYHQPGDWTELGELFETQEVGTAYASSEIKSDKEQDVGFFMVMDDAVRVWVNGKLAITELQNDYLSKYKYSYRVHLKKGVNKIVIKIYNLAKSKWGFNLEVSSLKYLQQNPVSRNYYSISDRYIYQKGEEIILRTKYPDLLSAQKKAAILVRDIKGEVVLDKQLPLKGLWKLPSDNLKEGIYSFKLSIDSDTLEDHFLIGDLNLKILDLQKNAVPGYYKNKNDSINIQTLVARVSYLNKFGQENPFDEQLERKLTSAIYQLEFLLKKDLEHKGSSPYVGPGLHIKGFKSIIDGKTDNYMVYLPPAPMGKNIPLMVVTPYVALDAPFISNWHVADIDRIEAFEMLARKYHIAVLWPGARIYATYNLNPIVSTAIFEAIAEVKKHYPIDHKKVFLYGICSGGLQALLLANRYPSQFAAVAAEGPELSYTKNDNSQGMYPPSWTKKNNIFNTIVNYSHIPVFLLHSTKDEKAIFGITEKLRKGIQAIGGNVAFDSLSNRHKDKWIDMIAESYSLSKAFAFFSDKKLSVPDTLKFSAYQLKYNQYYWLTITNISGNEAGYIEAYASNQKLYIKQNNINSFIVDLHQIEALKHLKKISVFLNGKEKSYSVPADGKLEISNGYHQTSPIKNHDTEGPVNHIFAKKFLLVYGTNESPAMLKSYKAAIDTIATDWQRQFHVSLTYKKDVDLSQNDISNNNIIIIGNTKNKILLKAEQFSSYKSNDHLVQISNHIVDGNHLTYMFIQPNAINNHNYILRIGSNYENYSWDTIKGLALRGWYDYEIWDGIRPRASGYFNSGWK